LNLEKKKVNQEKYYCVGYSPELKKYILAKMITQVVWFNRYYAISEEEYNAFGTVLLDELADILYKQGCNSERFLFSEKKEENNQNQLKLQDEIKK